MQRAPLSTKVVVARAVPEALAGMARYLARVVQEAKAELRGPAAPRAPMVPLEPMAFVPEDRGEGRLASSISYWAIGLLADVVSLVSEIAA